MGADLCGYTLVRPARGAATLAENHVKKLCKVITNPKLSDFQKVSKLSDLGVFLDDVCADEEITDKEFLTRVQLDLAEAKDFELKGFYRDLNSRYAIVKGKRIEVLFAGERTWGDEPDGLGYQALKLFCRLGISDVWENALKK